MKGLIEVKRSVIGSQSIDAVSARELYIGLGLEKSNWARWLMPNIEQNEFFKQGIDFIELVIKTSVPNPPKDFAISIEFAKHISMMARTEKGHEYRNYFLELEKKSQSTTDMVLVANQFEGTLKLAALFNLNGNQALIHANNAVKKLTGVDCQKLLDVELQSPVNEITYTVTDIGKKLGLSPIKTNLLLAEKGLQVKEQNNKKSVWQLTEKGKKYGKVIDAGVPHSTRMVEQIKWYESVIEELK